MDTREQQNGKSVHGWKDSMVGDAAASFKKVRSKVEMTEGRIGTMIFLIGKKTIMILERFSVIV